MVCSSRGREASSSKRVSNLAAGPSKMAEDFLQKVTSVWFHVYPVLSITIHLVYRPFAKFTCVFKPKEEMGWGGGGALRGSPAPSESA